MRFVLVLAILCTALPAWANIPDCEALKAYTDGVYRIGVVSPGGESSLSEQGILIHVELYDCTPAPIANFPFQDIWVGDPGTGELWLCTGGSVADANTDQNGYTTISGPIYAGGHTEGGTMVHVNGQPVDDTGPLPLDFVSPDLDGDGDVDLADFGRFGIDFGTTETRSDLAPDGVVDLSDFGVFGRHFGTNCP